MNKKELQNQLKILENEHLFLRIEEGELNENPIRDDSKKNRLIQISSKKKKLETQITEVSYKLNNI